MCCVDNASRVLQINTETINTTIRLEEKIKAPLLDDTSLNQLDYFPLGHYGVGEVQAPVFPLNRAVHVQSVTQPVIRRTSE